MSKTIQITTMSEGAGTFPVLYALRDDGSIWFKIIRGNCCAWERLDDIDDIDDTPGTQNS